MAMLNCLRTGNSVFFRVTIYGFATSDNKTVHGWGPELSPNCPSHNSRYNINSEPAIFINLHYYIVTIVHVRIRMRKKELSYAAMPELCAIP